MKDSALQGGKRKWTFFSFDGFCSHCKTAFESMGCFHHFCACQEVRPFLTEEDIQCGSKKRDLDELSRSYIQEEGFTVIEKWECEWWRLHKTTTYFKLHIREYFRQRRSLTEHQLLERIKKVHFFYYAQCDIEVPQKLRANFANFLPIFKNTSLSKHVIGDLMKTYAEEEGIMSQPRNMSISSFILQNGTLNAPFLLFFLQLGLVVTKTHRVVECTPKKGFTSFLEAAGDARR